MRNSWPKVELGQVVTRVKEEINVHDEQTYARLTIRMNGNGIVLRDRIPGHEIGTKKQCRVTMQEGRASMGERGRGVRGVRAARWGGSAAQVLAFQPQDELV